MSENIKYGKTTTQRRSEAVERRKELGLKAHEAFPGTLQARTQDVQRDFGILNEENRYPKSARPDRYRSHHSLERTSWGKKALIAGGMAVAAIGAGAALDAIAPEPADPPHPGNMESFKNDPLQEAYNQNPSGFDIEGGQIVPEGHTMVNGVPVPDVHIGPNGQVTLVDVQPAAPTTSVPPQINTGG